MRVVTIFIFVALSVACSTSSGSTPDNTTGPMNDPPGENEPAEVPDGPDVILPEDERPKTAADSASPTADDGEESGPRVSRAEVDAFMEKGPPYVLTLVTVEPARDDSGGFVGYQITDVTRSARAFMMPQLQVGDVVTHVNGVKQAKPEDLVNAWKSLRRVDAVRVDFLRRGQQKTATWSIR